MNVAWSCAAQRHTHTHTVSRRPPQKSEAARERSDGGKLDKTLECGAARGVRTVLAWESEVRANRTTNRALDTNWFSHIFFEKHKPAKAEPKERRSKVSRGLLLSRFFVFLFSLPFGAVVFGSYSSGSLRLVFLHISCTIDARRRVVRENFLEPSFPKWRDKNKFFFGKTAETSLSGWE